MKLYKRNAGRMRADPGVSHPSSPKYETVPKSLSEKCERLKKPEKNGRIALTVGFGPSVHH
jgi:hypothetical protein